MGAGGNSNPGGGWNAYVARNTFTFINAQKIIVYDKFFTIAASPTPTKLISSMQLLYNPTYGIYVQRDKTSGEYYQPYENISVNPYSLLAEAIREENSRDHAVNQGSVKNYSWWSDFWNNSVITKIIPDVIYFNQGTSYNFVGGGGYATGYALPIRGKDAFHLYSTITLYAKVGAHGNIGINIGYSSYMGDARDFDFDESFGGNGTRGFDSDIVFGIGANVNADGDLYSYDIGFGPAVGASVNIGSSTYVKRIW